MSNHFSNHCFRQGDGVFKPILGISNSEVARLENSFSSKEGHMSYGQAAILFNITAINSVSKIIEIGSLYGRSSCIFLSAAKEATIDCIDTFEYSLDGKSTSKNYFDKFESNTAEHKTRITITKDLSYNVPGKFEDQKYDLLFIDGDHSYDGVYKDIIYYHNKLRPGGLILGHDYPHPMVERFNFNGLMHCVNGIVRDRPDVFYDFGYLGGIWGARYLGTPLN